MQVQMVEVSVPAGACPPEFLRCRYIPRYILGGERQQTMHSPSLRLRLDNVRLKGVDDRSGLKERITASPEQTY